ncbi:MAG: isoleucine--tRNA ligase [Flavobacteriales bacterium]|nr:isoleucine--tRNA ligase [Flavobacteriales bacterium]MDG1779582.1 isoleucine--tRNA ligase [Flavobacteriales bacterium]
MASKYPEYKQLNLPHFTKEVMEKWENDDTFKQSISIREGAKPYVFFEGPPSANGLPGIHHVMGRAIKDIFCRYKTLKGYQVNRKAGWDTHGLPVELGVEKELGITKEDIGKKITVEEYNIACRKAVMRYTDVWNNLTKQMGYWVDMSDPYVTYENKYIESVWWLLKQLHNQNMLYKGYTIQPYSPKAGTGLSTHELNQPGTYRDVKDTTIVAQFKISTASRERFEKLATEGTVEPNAFLLAWTTTPWTLPSNTALTVGPKIDYVLVNTRNKYTDEAQTVVMAEALMAKHLPVKKGVEFEVIGKCKGTDLLELTYEQLLPWATPMEDTDKAFRVIPGAFVTTEDGTGIVHTAPTFGADDALVARDAGVPPMLVDDGQGNGVPLVDLQGRFIENVGPVGGKYVKNEYYLDVAAPDKSVDVEIAIMLKEQGLAFNVEKYEHSYPHCWRTDKPILYYPLDSWFVKATAAKERMTALNNTINWKPESTGTGRFGNWLENVNDWNLSRSRFWGIPIPIWRTEDGTESICIGSVEELKTACEASVAAGLMETNPLADFTPTDMSEENYNTFDLHKPYADKIVLVSSNGEPMVREADLIDVWFDSGSMPYAQWHYPFENKEKIDNNEAFPADFIAEGVDQTRGWFYTLHAIGTMCFDSVAYKNVVSNGLVLDKNGQKMSKRLGNAVDPFKTLEKYGPDATRWYMITNAQPWDNLKFDEDGITEVQRKFFGTLYNTYNFFALYANIDNFSFNEELIPLQDRPELDQWIWSRLHSLIANVDDAYAHFEPTRAGRLIQEFTVDELSNWYVRLSRRRFWKGDYNADKISAYQTLYTCLETIAILSSPIAPFFTDKLFGDLNSITKRSTLDSVHLVDFPASDSAIIQEDLEERMSIAQKVSSMVLSLRKKERIRVRQPLQKIMVPILDTTFEDRLKKVEALILSELNVKELEYLHDTGVLVKQIKPNFKALGPRFGKQMKLVAAAVSAMTQEQIAELEQQGKASIDLEGFPTDILLTDVEISSQDIPGWLVASEGGISVALDITISESLREEGIAREMVNRIQNLRKDSGLEVTDRISLRIKRNEAVENAVQNNFEYICQETLAGKLELVDMMENGHAIEVDESVSTEISIETMN